MNDESGFPRNITNRLTLQWLLVPVILLPLGMTFLFSFGRLFIMLDDSLSASILDCCALGLGLVWLLSVFALLLCVVFVLLSNDKDTHPG